MIVLASVSSPVGDHGRARRRAATRSIGHVLLLDALRSTSAPRSRSVAEEDVASARRRSRASCRTRPAARARPAAQPTSSASSRWAVTSGGSPATSRLPAGISSRSRVERRPGTGAPARPCRRRAAGTTDDGARVVDDVALERARRRAPRSVPTPSEMTCALVDRPARRAGGTPRSRRSRARVSRPSAGSRRARMRCGLRPSARPSAAPTNSRNSGAGRSGRLLNSGWAWVPTQNGWPVELDELDQPAVGRRARAHEAGCRRTGCGSAG